MNLKNVVAGIALISSLAACDSAVDKNKVGHKVINPTPTSESNIIMIPSSRPDRIEVIPVPESADTFEDDLYAPRNLVENFEGGSLIVPSIVNGPNKSRALLLSNQNGECVVDVYSSGEYEIPEGNYTAEWFMVDDGHVVLQATVRAGVHASQTATCTVRIMDAEGEVEYVEVVGREQ